MKKVLEWLYKLTEICNLIDILHQSSKANKKAKQTTEQKERPKEEPS